MIEELQSIKIQLHDAPSEVKLAFNNLIQYFSLDDLRKRLNRRRKYNSHVFFSLLIKDYSEAKSSRSFNQSELYQNFLLDMDLVFTELKNPDKEKIIQAIDLYASNAKEATEKFFKKGIKENLTNPRSTAFQEFKIKLWESL